MKKTKRSKKNKSKDYIYLQDPPIWFFVGLGLAVFVTVLNFISYRCLDAGGLGALACFPITIPGFLVSGILFSIWGAITMPGAKHIDVPEGYLWPVTFIGSFIVYFVIGALISYFGMKSTKLFNKNKR